MHSRTPAGLVALVEYLKRNRGFDFTGYKPASLERRVQTRMSAVGVRRYPDYVDYLEVHPEEFEILFNAILINVTSFFRDANAWSFLARRVIPKMITHKPEGAPVRIWSAGCASGEEAYSLAMLFSEAMGAKGFRERVRIYATDIDEDALANARRATYDERVIADVPHPLLGKYFEQSGARYAVRKDLRRNVIFGRHDLIHDSAISRVDLVACRNTLMYFNAETQARIIERFHSALNDSGVLFLGRAETPLSPTRSFASLHVRSRISVKVARARLDLSDRMQLIDAGEDSDKSRLRRDVNMRLHESALDSLPMPMLVVDVSGSLVFANQRALSLFGLNSTDQYQPTLDLEHAQLPPEIRSSVEQARSGRPTEPLRNVEWRSSGGETRWFDVQAVPVADSDGIVIGATITFADVTAVNRLQRELINANQELESAYEALQSTHEEQETTAEELQSLVEEFETSNEALQSTNGALETMNAELRSTNNELVRSNASLESILTGLRGAVAVVDAELEVLVWKDAANDLWGVHAEDAVGRNLLDLEIGLPLERLKKPIHECLTGARDFIELQLDATDRKGRTIQCRVTCSPVFDIERRVSGVLVLLEDLDVPRVSELRREHVRREAERRPNKSALQ